MSLDRVPESDVMSPSESDVTPGPDPADPGVTAPGPGVTDPGVTDLRHARPDPGVTGLYPAAADHSVTDPTSSERPPALRPISDITPRLTVTPRASRPAPVVKDLPELKTEPTVVVSLPRATTVGVHDTPAARLRYPADLLGIIGSALGIVGVCLLVVYAGNTTAGLTEDVQGVAKWLQRLLNVPVLFIHAVLVLFVTIAVSVSLAMRRQFSILLTSLASALAGLIVNLVFLTLLQVYAPDSLRYGLSVHGSGTVTMPQDFAAMVALLTAASHPSRRRPLTMAWTMLWVTVGVDVLTSRVTLGGGGLALLTGLLVGLCARYLVGVPTERAYGPDLIDALTKVGFDPTSLDRASLVHFGDTGAEGGRSRVQVPQFFADHRLYALKTTSGELFDVVVLDGDRQVVGMITRWWRQLRSRGIDPRSVTSLRQSAERAALLAYSVKAAGVRTPGVLAMAEAGDSMLLVREPVPESVMLADLPAEDVTDRLARHMWKELGKAHRAGTVHRMLTDQVFRVHETPSGTHQIWILGWESGDVAGSQLAERIDQAQLLALTALRLGAGPAVDVAIDLLPDDQLRDIGPLLQTPAMPARTRELLRARPTLLADLRAHLSAHFPQAEMEPQKLARVSARTVVSALLVAVALFAVLTTFNLQAVTEALQSSRWYWAVAAFGFGLVGILGATLILLALSPVRIPFGKAVLSQLAASYVAVSVPAGIGTAGLNLRFLTKRGVPGTLATATAALIQVSQIVITVLMLLVLTLATGSTQASTLGKVSPAILIAAAALAAVIGVGLAIPRVRAWILGKVMPTLRQTWPRLVDLVSSPTRLLLGVGGNLLMLLAYALAFQAALWAFGQDVDFVASSIAYLIGNSAGSAAPTPGGMGAIEAAEMAALGTAGVNAGIAASVVVVFRLATFWIRIPLGLAAYRALEKRGDL